MNELEIPPEFIEENRQNSKSQFMPKLRRRGPYSKHDKEARRNEVYRLHFEYGYSGRKIADRMRVNRNTVNNDIQYLYSQAIRKSNALDPEQWVQIHSERMEIQRTRLREKLDNATNSSEQNVIEKQIFELESKILQTRIKLFESIQMVHERATDIINHWLEKEGHTSRYHSFYDLIKVSDEANLKIKKIIKEDRMKGDWE